MEWKKEATEKLRQYNAMRRASENLPAEIKLLQADAVALPGSAVTLRVRGGGIRREDALIDNIVKRRELEWKLDRVRDWLSITNRGLDALAPEDRMVLQRLYLSPEKGAIGALCAELGVEQSTVYRKRDRAIYNFTMALYGIPEM